MWICLSDRQQGRTLLLLLLSEMYLLSLSMIFNPQLFPYNAVRHFETERPSKENEKVPLLVQHMGPQTPTIIKWAVYPCSKVMAKE